VTWTNLTPNPVTLTLLHVPGSPPGHPARRVVLVEPGEPAQLRVQVIGPRQRVCVFRSVRPLGVRSVRTLSAQRRGGGHRLVGLVQLAQRCRGRMPDLVEPARRPAGGIDVIVVAELSEGAG